MKTIATLAQYSVLLVCVAACGVMLLCLGVGAFFGRVADLLEVGWVECRKLTALLALCTMSAGAAEVPAQVLVATVDTQTITNVVEGNNQKGCSTCNSLRPGGGQLGTTILLYHPLHQSEPWQEATERWTITNVIKRVTIRFQWDGEDWVQVKDKLVSSTTNLFKLEAAWIKQP